MSEKLPPREPTSDECSNKAPLGDGWYALWYPQMGGYVGRAAVHVDANAVEGLGCDVYVWHDGDFPFRGGDTDGWARPKQPRLLYHTDTDQFRRFADDIDAIIEQVAQDTSA